MGRKNKTLESLATMVGQEKRPCRRNVRAVGGRTCGAAARQARQGYAEPPGLPLAGRVILAADRHHHMVIKIKWAWAGGTLTLETRLWEGKDRRRPRRGAGLALTRQRISLVARSQSRSGTARFLSRHINKNKRGPPHRRRNGPLHLFTGPESRKLTGCGARR